VTQSANKPGQPGIANPETDAAAEALRIARSPKLRARLAPYLPELPIFPLYKVQLFPSAVLPLYVFEPRYRAMTADCLTRGGIMAVASLRPGYGSAYAGRPPVRRIAGIGRIVAHRQNPDGTYNILLRGLARVVICSELPETPDCLYRKVRARILADRWPQDFDLQGARRTLIALTERLASLVPHGGEALRALCAGDLPSRRLCDVLSAALVWPPKLRRRLLELRDLPARVDLLSAELARLCVKLQGGAGSGAN
jgi:Lon protease-like protein